MKPRKRPCASCPYRRDVPSGVWAAKEYEKLEGYDGSTGEQAIAGALGVFACHTGPGDICAGWAHLADEHTLALRIAVLEDPDVDVEAVLAYATDVPLWASGHEAAEHGRAEVEEPSYEAARAVAKVTKVRARAGKPVEYG